MKKNAVDSIMLPQTALILPICEVCGEVPEQGIRDAIKIKRIFICSRCEKAILKAETGSGKYELIMQKIRAIFK